MKVTVVNPITPYNSASYECLAVTHNKNDDIIILLTEETDESGNYISHQFPAAFLYMIET